MGTNGLKNKSGFTLIELMIVIAIIAILMSYAIPAYRDYTVRTKAGEAMSVASGIRTSISESWVAAENISTLNSGSGAIPPANSVTGTNVEKVQVNGGVIEVSFNNNDPSLQGKTLTLTPNVPGSGGNAGSSLMWDCTSDLLPQHNPC